MLNHNSCDNRVLFSSVIFALHTPKRWRGTRSCLQKEGKRVFFSLPNNRAKKKEFNVPLKAIEYQTVRSSISFLLFAIEKIITWAHTFIVSAQDFARQKLLFPHQSTSIRRSRKNSILFQKSAISGLALPCERTSFFFQYFVLTVTQVTIISFE